MDKSLCFIEEYSIVWVTVLKLNVGIFVCVHKYFNATYRQMKTLNNKKSTGKCKERGINVNFLKG